MDHCHLPSRYDLQARLLHCRVCLRLLGLAVHESLGDNLPRADQVIAVLDKLTLPDVTAHVHAETGHALLPLQGQHFRRALGQQAEDKPLHLFDQYILGCAYCGHCLNAVLRVVGHL
jgi:hypothetical protein